MILKKKNSRSSGQQRYGRAYFELTESKGDLEVDWILLFLENMNIKAIANYENRHFKSQSRIEAFYINPNQSFEYIKVGGDGIMGELWSYVSITFIQTYILKWWCFKGWR